MGRANNPEDVFSWINTHKNDPTVCWEWVGSTGGRDHRGYFTLDGQKKLAHRVVFEIFHGKIPDKVVIRHKCDNPLCCNPFHLEQGSRSDNELDKYKRDRAGYPIEVVKEIHRLAALPVMPDGISEVTDERIKDYVNGKFATRVSRSGVQKVRSGKRRLAQKD